MVNLVQVTTAPAGGTASRTMVTWDGQENQGFDFEGCSLYSLRFSPATKLVWWMFNSFGNTKNDDHFIKPGSSACAAMPWIPDLPPQDPQKSTAPGRHDPRGPPRDRRLPHPPRESHRWRAPPPVIWVARDVKNPWNGSRPRKSNEHEIRFENLGKTSTGYWRLTHGSSFSRPSPRQQVKKPWALPLTTMMNCPALLSNAWISPTNSQTLKTFMWIIIQCYANTWQIAQPSFDHNEAVHFVPNLLLSSCSHPVIYFEAGGFPINTDLQTIRTDLKPSQTNPL